MLRVLLSLIVATAVVQEPARLLRIDAVALDRDGNLYPDLKQDEIEVWINGLRIPIQSITVVRPGANERPGRLILLLLDDLTVSPPMVLRVREVARRFVAHLAPGDRMGVVRLSGGLGELTSEPARLLKRVESFNQSGSFVPVDRLGAQVLTTVARLSGDMIEAPEGRKVIVGIGSGWLLDRPIPPPQMGELRREWLEAVRAMSVAAATFYVIDPGGVGASRPLVGSDSFARDSGGQAFVNTNDLAGAVDRILGETHSYYEIRVEDPPVGRKATVRDLDVRSLRRDVSVRARRLIPGG